MNRRKDPSVKPNQFGAKVLELGQEWEDPTEARTSNWRTECMGRFWYSHGGKEREVESVNRQGENRSSKRDFITMLIS
ncbi:MAG: hypothetical protein ACP5U1_11915 [Desulfomonilaceae bacterium]